MNKLYKYAFLVKHLSYKPNEQKSILQTKEFITKIIGVSNTEEAIAVINDLIEKEFQLVELCGGFTEEEHGIIKNKIKKYLPIGLVKFTQSDIKLLNDKIKNN